MTPVLARDRADRCPGVGRPWLAADGALVRIRLIGGRVERSALRALAEVAGRYGEPDLYLTRRANVQLRGLPTTCGALAAEVAAALRATGLVPSEAHELVRNVMVSPLSGIAGGRADLRGVAAELDRRLCADPRLAGLPGRFLFVLDDGRGDVAGRALDLGLVALDADRVQLRAGREGWGAIVHRDAAPAALIALAHRFLDRRGEGDTAAWHVDELPAPLLDPDTASDTASNTPAPDLGCSGPVPFGPGPGYRHQHVPDGVLTPALLDVVLAEPGTADPVVVTPWHGLLLPEAGSPGVR